MVFLLGWCFLVPARGQLSDCETLSTQDLSLDVPVTSLPIFTSTIWRAKARPFRGRVEELVALFATPNCLSPNDIIEKHQIARLQEVAHSPGCSETSLIAKVRMHILKPKAQDDFQQFFCGFTELFSGCLVSEILATYIGAFGVHRHSI